MGRIVLWAVLLFLSISLPKEAWSENKVKNIVFFFSLNAAVPAYQSILDAFRNSFPEQTDEPYNLMIEYLDLGRFPKDDHPRQIVELYNEKFREAKIDLIITVAPGTWQLLNELGLEALHTSKVIDVELENIYNKSEILLPKENTVQINVKLDPAKTLNHAFNLFPEAKNVFVFSGTSTTDNYMTDITWKAAKKFENTHHFNYYSMLPIDSILLISRKIPDNSIVFIPSFMVDTRKIPMSTSLFISSIANQCKAPIFTLSDNFMNRGGIGGYVYSFYNLGKEIKRISLELFKEIKPKDILVRQDGYYQYMYNWDQLTRWNLQNSPFIPSNSIFYNRKVSFLSQYFWLILIGLTFIVVESFLLVYFIQVNRQKKNFIRQKAENERLYRELIRDDRMMQMAGLTASLSHELYQPLTAILYSAQAGLRFLESEKLDSAQAKEILEMIVEDDKRAAGIIHSVRSLMKSEIREKETFNFQDLIHETMNIFHYETVQHNIQIRLGLSGKPVWIFGDRIQIQQVLLNLFSNAIRAMEDSEIEKRIIEIRQKINANSAIVSVRDHGSGINPAIKDKLFKPFQTTHKGGLGIGLSISQSIIERHNGVIWAENMEDGGAEFSFTLRLAENE